jgi:hypothetical protein
MSNQSHKIYKRDLQDAHMDEVKKILALSMYESRHGELNDEHLKTISEVLIYDFQCTDEVLTHDYFSTAKISKQAEISNNSELHAYGGELQVDKITFEDAIFVIKTPRFSVLYDISFIEQ